MTYTHQKKDGQNVYRTEDVFGELEVKSGEELDGSTLDELCQILIKSGNAETVSGSVPGRDITYTFKRAPTWSDTNDT